MQMGQGLLRKHWRQGQVPLVRGLQHWQGMVHGQGQSLEPLGLGQMLSWDQALVRELKGHCWLGQGRGCCCLGLGLGLGQG